MKPVYHQGSMMAESCIPSSSTAVELTAEDAECAHALLDLARSSSVNRAPQRNEKENVERPNRNIISQVTTKKKITVKKTVFDKIYANNRFRKAEQAYRKEDFRNKIDLESSEPYKEVDKKIKLDHSYCLSPWEGDYPKQVNPAFYSLLDEVEGNGGSVMTPKDTPRKWGKVALPPGMRTFHPSHPGHEIKQRANNTNRSSDIYQPDNNNYKNFNLLLKCLTAGENREDIIASRKRCYSTMVESKSKTDMGTPSSLEVGFAEESKCSVCKKVFSSPTYLRKHRQRMHPAYLPEPRIETDSIVCTSCSVLVEKASFERHVCKHEKVQGRSSSAKAPGADVGLSESLVIDESPPPLDACQFCGIRMRKGLLEQHINLEHSLESGISSGDTQQDNISESGSETLSGSDQDHGEDIISCDICYAYVQKSFLGQHIREKHLSLVSGTGYADLSKPPAATHNPHMEPFMLNQFGHRTVSGVPKVKDPLFESPNNVSPPVSSEPVGHYMLQRFLRENHDGSPIYSGEKRVSMDEQQGEGSMGQGDTYPGVERFDHVRSIEYVP